MQDILVSIKAYLYDRAASPLIGAFFVAWSLWNYKILMIVFLSGDDSLAQRLALIDQVYRSVVVRFRDAEFLVSGGFLHGFFIPLLISLFYIYLYPILAKPVFRFSVKSQNELHQLKHEVEGARLLSEAESREIFGRLRTIQARQAEEKTQYETEIQKLTERIRDLEAIQVTGGNLTKPNPDDLDEDPEVYSITLEGRKRVEDALKYLESILDDVDPGEFELNQLFGQLKWRELEVTERKLLGKLFKQAVDRGDYVGVSAVGKTSGNRQRYFKNS